MILQFVTQVFLVLLRTFPLNALTAYTNSCFLLLLYLFVGLVPFHTFHPSFPLHDSYRFACSQGEYASLPPGQIVPAWPIRGCTSPRRAAFTWYSMSMASFTVAVVHGHHRNRARFHGSGPQEQSSCGVGPLPSCPLACAGSGFTSTWCSTSGAATSWPGMLMSGRIQPLQLIW